MRPAVFTRVDRRPMMCDRSGILVDGLMDFGVRGIGDVDAKARLKAVT